MLIVTIKGVRSPERLRDVEQIVGSTELYRKGTNDDLYVNYGTRERADLDVVNLNLIPGIKAEINGDRQTG